MNQQRAASLLHLLLLIGIKISVDAAFAPQASCPLDKISSNDRRLDESTETKSKLTTLPSMSSRGEFLSSSKTMAILLVGATSTNTLLGNGNVAWARGRATLEQSYDRYAPRIIAGGEFYKRDLRQLIESNDWAGIKEVTAEPPKKTKADNTKADGGVSERAAKAGQFSEARVLNAMDLYASAFSDNSISAKTKSMRSQVDELRKVVQGLSEAAKLALGEEKPSGGFLGFGAKQPSQKELSTTIRQLYLTGGNAWNQYVFSANEGLPLSLQKFPYL